ncbi:MAG TPA: glycosyltransferase, partial [Ktedonobacterales bacterium]|nr:glycosyltransferase [Ktedonobacterales bacterium]
MNGPARQRRVLFLIADTGAGHRSAANAIHHAMRLLADSSEHSLPRAPVPVGAGRTERPRRGKANDGWEATIVDAFVESMGFALRKSASLYGPAIKHSPRLYGRFFRMTNTSSRFTAAWRLARPFWYQGLMRLFVETQPDVIVSVHPLLNHSSLKVLRDLGVKVPFITVVTDLVSVHCAWLARDVTAIVVPTQAAYDLALEAGIPAKRIFKLGMPIDPKFARPALGNRAELRQELGLDANLPTALLVGGGEGAIGLAEAATALGHSALKMQMVVVTGRNQQLHSHLLHARRSFTIPAQVLGFVHNMPDLMRAADVIVTKAGPGTITEAMACELPIVLTGAIPGQEEGNLDWVVRHELGILAQTPDEVVAALGELLMPGSAKLERLRQNVRQVSQPEAAFNIARLILKQLPAAAEQSVWQRASRATAHRRYVRRASPALSRPLVRTRGSGARIAITMRGEPISLRPMVRRIRVASENGTAQLPGLVNLR